MRITWHIEKKRGNLRPVLDYAVVLEGSEKALALPFVRIDSTIPEPPASWQPHCYPNEHERAGLPPAGCYALATPRHDSRNRSQILRLPDAGKVDQKVITAEFDLRNQIQLVLKKQIVQIFTGCTFSVQHKDRVVQKFFERNLLSF